MSLNRLDAIAGKIIVATSAPASPSVGDIWFDSTNKLMYFYSN